MNEVVAPLANFHRQRGCKRPTDIDDHHSSKVPKLLLSGNLCPNMPLTTSTIPSHHNLQPSPAICKRQRSIIADDSIHPYSTVKIPKLIQCPLKTIPKPVLILDLDHTLLHSTFLALDNLDNKDLLYTWFTARSERVTTKLRPLVHTFLREVRNLGFDMYIYTMGTRSYAHAIAEMLDPCGIYFKKEKIISRESTKNDRKSLNMVPAVDEKKVVIVDDTVGVWPKNWGNLINIKKYYYFDNPNSKLDEMDDALVRVLDVLRRVQRMMPYFNDVRIVLREIRNNILRGCRIVFTWKVPSKMMIIARELGATCSIEVDEVVDATTTHVVSSRTTTMAGQWAIENGRFLVTADWVEEAYYSWRRPKEKQYLITG